jgi:tRNA1(Val) A37 N6-methylase TrmN6
MSFSTAPDFLFSTIAQLTSEGGVSHSERWRQLALFAHSFGWRPSDRLDLPSTAEHATGHLLVEHGLEHAAVVSFLRSPHRYLSLPVVAQQRLLSVPYNNLVDWTIAIEAEHVSIVYIRTQTPTIVDSYPLHPGTLERLRVEAFEKIVGERPTPNIPALDDALIRTISTWRRNISAELSNAISIDTLSQLFNSIIFVRALEDAREPLGPQTAAGGILLQHFDAAPQSRKTLRLVLTSALQSLARNPPTYLFDPTLLKPLDGLAPMTTRALFVDFYRNRYAPYAYDFSIMSKHALSRLYEHYVSSLRREDSAQLTLLEPLPVESRDRSQGAIYTPQFIARFFARFLREQLPPFAFKRIRSIDPACGSGIFLRTLLELQCDPMNEGSDPTSVKMAFDRVVGSDNDTNAAQATRLSLALLHLVLTSELPDAVRVFTLDAIEMAGSEPLKQGAFDVVVANPPFVKLDEQDARTRETIVKFLGEDSVGRPDTYLAFVKLSLQLLKPGGFGLLVLPHNFLLAKNAERLRAQLSQETWIRCLVDLSSVRVFEDVGAYVVLLIFEKRSELQPIPPPVLVAKCRDAVSRALQDVLDGRTSDTPLYSVYETGQDVFADKSWLVLRPAENRVRNRLRSFPPLSHFAQLGQGIVTGADRVFLVDYSSIPEGEEEAYVPFLPDKEMAAYRVPHRPKRAVFYPYSNDGRLSPTDLRKRFPQTWQRLNKHRAELESRKSLERYGKAWWEPFWARSREQMLVPKIVTPHLVLLPKFAIDLQGIYAISHSPFITTRNDADVGLLLYLLGVLNSGPCFWFINAHAHHYMNGYTRLEKGTLAATPIPDPSRLSTTEFRDFIDLVRRRLKTTSDDSGQALTAQIDSMVGTFYGLDSAELRAIGMA